MFILPSFSYLGIQRAVMDFTAEYLKGESGGTERRDSFQKQHGWAEMKLAYEKSQSLTYRVLSEVGPNPSQDQLARAWAATLVAMETVSDFGTVSFFNVQTLTTAIYDSWIFYDDLNAWGFESCFSFMQSVGEHFLKAYLPIVERRKDISYSEKERDFQL